MRQRLFFWHPVDLFGRMAVRRLILRSLHGARSRGRWPNLSRARKGGREPRKLVVIVLLCQRMIIMIVLLRQRELLLRQRELLLRQRGGKRRQMRRVKVAKNRLRVAKRATKRATKRAAKRAKTAKRMPVPFTSSSPTVVARFTRMLSRALRKPVGPVHSSSLPLRMPKSVDSCAALMRLLQLKLCLESGPKRPGI
jgi:hypothetical protein